MRIGFVIVDPSLRKKGYGKKLMKLSIEYAYKNFDFDVFGIGAFENNLAALHCYESVGFKKVGEDFYTIFNETWKCIELEYK